MENQFFTKLAIDDVELKLAGKRIVLVCEDEQVRAVLLANFTGKQVRLTVEPMDVLAEVESERPV